MKKVAWIGIGLGLLFWIAESFVHTLFFRTGDIGFQIIPADLHELWIRTFVTLMIILFGFYAQFIINKYQNVESANRLAYAELRQIFDTTADGIRLVTRDFEVLDTNQMFKKLADLKSDPIGKKCYETFRGSFCHTEKCPLVLLQRGETRIEVDIEKIRRDGSKVHCILTATPFYNPGGEFIGIVENFKDITERIHVEEKIQGSLLKLQRTIDGTIRAMARLVEKIDPYTAGHQRRVAQLAYRIARELLLPKDRIQGIYVASLIHDIGKIAVPHEILNKTSKLTRNEFKKIKEHPSFAYDILKAIEFPWPVARIVLQHHERMDGSGYPYGLPAKEIVFEARIVAVADVVEALASDRPYRPALGQDEIFTKLSSQKGKCFDKTIVDICFEILTENGFDFNAIAEPIEIYEYAA